MANQTPTVIDRGPWNYADANGRMDANPTDYNNGCVTLRYIDTSAAALSIVSTNILGGERVNAPEGGENGIFDVRVPVDWTVVDTAFYIRIVEAQTAAEKADSTSSLRPIVGAKVTIQGKESITNSNGYAKFEGLTPGSTQIKVDANNYMYNVSGMGTDRDTDSDTFNDTVVVPDLSTKKYQLLESTFRVQIVGNRKVRSA